jgi:hypothetical protein
MFADYGNLPLSFEANEGQTDSEVRFLCRGPGYSLFLTDREAMLALRRQAPGVFRATDRSINANSTVSTNSFQTDVIRMQLVGANPAVSVNGKDKLLGTKNYFVGDDPKKWQSGVPTYSKVAYSHVYSGIDLIYYGNQRNLEYDYVVAPGADPGQIRIRFRGIRKLRIDKNGDLRVIAPNGEITFHAPLVSQTIEGHRQKVDARFSLMTGDTVGFALGRYDRYHALVIDPTLGFSTYLGGSTEEEAHGIAVDSSGSAYVVGETYSSNFPTETPYQSSNGGYANGASNVFIAKFTPDGSALVYSTYLGGNGVGPGQGDVGTAIAVDSSGEVYLTGLTFSSNFPTLNAYQATNHAAANGLSTPFVTKLNADGSALIFSTYLGGSSDIDSIDQGDSGQGIAVDSAGDVYVVGITYSVDFPVTAGAFQETNNGVSADFNNSNAFITKLNPSGDALLYSTYLGGSGIIGSSTNPNRYYFGDGASSIALDSAGNAYLTGIASSTDFPVTTSAYQTTNHAANTHSSNAFVTKVNPSGSGLVYSTYLGGSSVANPSERCEFCQNGDAGSGIAVGPDGSAYVSGGTYSADFPTTAGAFQSMNNAAANQASNAFVVKLNPAGTALDYSTLLGGTGSQGDVAYAIGIDGSGNAYLGGFTSSSDFPVTSSALQSKNNAAANGADNAFVAVVNPAGSGLAYSSYLGGSGSKNSTTGTYVGDVGYAIALDSSGNIYEAGSTASADFPTTTGALQSTNRATTLGEPNAFVTKLSALPIATTISTTTVLIASANPQTQGDAVVFTATVKPASGSGVPTGTVTFTVDGGTGITATLNSSAEATWSVTTLTAGAHTISASYLGDANDAASSETLTETITALQSEPAPTLSLSAGTYDTTQTVTISDSTQGATIFYTTDGSIPTSSSFKYSGPISITTSETITAIATEAGYQQSSPVAATYILQAAPPAFTPPPGTYSSQQTVSITDATPGSGIFYTLDGTAPTSSSARYMAPINVTSSETITAIAVATGFQQSAAASAAYVLRAAIPSFSPSPGTYTSSVTVTLTDASSGATIHFTTDGSVPSAQSPLYLGPITITASETIQAIGIVSGFAPSPVAVGLFTISAPPVLSAYGSEFPLNYTTPLIQVDEQISNGCQGKVGLPAISTFSDEYTSVLSPISNLQTYVNGSVRQNFFPLTRLSPGVWIPSSATYTSSPSFGGSGFIFPGAFGPNPTSTYNLTLSSAGILTVTETGSGTDDQMGLPNFTSVLNGTASWTSTEVVNLNTGSDQWQFSAVFNGSFPINRSTCTLNATLTASAKNTIRIILDGVLNPPPPPPPPGACTIISQTLAHVPGTDDTQRALNGRIGVGENVQLVLTDGNAATWTVTSGGGSLTPDISAVAPGTFYPNEGFPTKQCSGTPSSEILGTQVCFTAPDKASSVVITASLAPGSSCSATLTVAQPDWILFQRLQTPTDSPDYAFSYRFFDVFFDVQMESVAFVTPGDVSFANVIFKEEDIGQPHVDRRYNALFNIGGSAVDGTISGGTNAWLVGCDYDHKEGETLFAHHEDAPFAYEVFVEGKASTANEFSQVRTAWSLQDHKVLFSKQQIAALAADGITFEPTADVPASELSVLAVDFDDFVPVPDFAKDNPVKGIPCLNDVTAQFTPIP